MSQKKFRTFIEIKKGRYTNPSRALYYFKEEGLGPSFHKNTKMNVAVFFTGLSSDPSFMFIQSN